LDRRLLDASRRRVMRRHGSVGRPLSTCRANEVLGTVIDPKTGNRRSDRRASSAGARPSCKQPLPQRSRRGRRRRGRRRATIREQPLLHLGQVPRAVSIGRRSSSYTFKKTGLTCDLHCHACPRFLYPADRGSWSLARLSWLGPCGGSTLVTARGAAQNGVAAGHPQWAACEISACKCAAPP
jgi:hypothetical protein